MDKPLESSTEVSFNADGISNSELSGVYYIYQLQFPSRAISTQHVLNIFIQVLHLYIFQAIIASFTYNALGKHLQLKQQLPWGYDLVIWTCSGEVEKSGQAHTLQS